LSFDLSEYVDVKHRLNLALHKHPDLRVVEDAPELITIGERVYIQCAVTVFRSADDLLPGRAYSWEVWPGRTPFTKESEQQNGATSALGRCLGYMGFGIDTGLASSNEVRTAQGNNHPSNDPVQPGEYRPRWPANDKPTPERAAVGSRATAAPASPHYPHVHSDKPRGLATDAQLRLLNTMLKERGLPMPAAGITFTEASDEISRLKLIPKGK
jgi:hypothetical protein